MNASKLADMVKLRISEFSGKNCFFPQCGLVYGTVFSTVQYHAVQYSVIK